MCGLHNYQYVYFNLQSSWQTLKEYAASQFKLNDFFVLLLSGQIMKDDDRLMDISSNLGKAKGHHCQLQNRF
jgi:hypothetical protein